MPIERDGSKWTRQAIHAAPSIEQRSGTRRAVSRVGSVIPLAPPRWQCGAQRRIDDDARPRATHLSIASLIVLRGVAREQPGGDRGGASRIAERAADQHRPGVARTLDARRRVPQLRRLRRRRGRASGRTSTSPAVAAPGSSAQRSTTVAKRRGFARQRNAPEPDAVGDRDRLRFVSRPRPRIDEGARQIGREQQPRRQTHAPVSVLLETRPVQGRRSWRRRATAIRPATAATIPRHRSTRRARRHELPPIR